MGKKKRFEKLYEQGTLEVYKIIRDNETGVNYLVYGANYGAGLTPLLDAEGKVVVTPVNSQEANE